jgi:hypothetical protein
MSGFTKLWQSILDSTIWLAPDQTRIVWITILAMSDRWGRVESSIPGLANRAHVTLEATQAALEALQQPDPFSRTQAYGGRRITPIAGGWVILNYAEYRKMQDDEDRRDQMREAKARQREREKSSGNGTPNDDGHQMSSSDTPMSSKSVKNDDCQQSASASASVSDTGRVPEGESEGGKRIPTIQEWLDEAKAKHPDWPLEDIKQSFLYYDSIGWKRGKTPVTKWKLCIATCYHNWTKFHPAAQVRPDFRREVPAG